MTVTDIDGKSSITLAVGQTEDWDIIVANCNVCESYYNYYHYYYSKCLELTNTTTTTTIAPMLATIATVFVTWKKLEEAQNGVEHRADEERKLTNTWKLFVVVKRKKS